jgi:dihydrofolate reductase
LKIIIIAAISKNGIIGRSSGEMPWHLKEEFQHFKNTTMGFPIIMGRKTFESLGKPLKGRLNIVVTRNQNLKLDFDEVKKFYSLKESLDYCLSTGKEKVFITGGGEIYKQAIGIADEMILSFLTFDAEGDVYFPKIDMEVWKEESREQRNNFEIVRFLKLKDSKIEN